MTGARGSPGPGTLGQALREAIPVLAAAGVEDPAGDARRLLAHAMGLPLDRLTLLMSRSPSTGEAEAFARLVARRARREPVSHLTGARQFWGRPFRVTPAVLDPRPETETLVACALEEPFRDVLDLGTGSGCILVTLLAERPVARGLGVDLSPEALAVAGENARRHGVGERARLAPSSWFSAVQGRFDLIVSNPPYIALHEVAGLAPEVRDHEPRLALTDEGDGLSAYRAILADAGAHLAPGGRVIVEVGAGQAEAVLAIGLAAGLAGAETRDDLDGRPRACLFRAP